MNLRLKSLAALSFVCIAGLGIAAAARMDDWKETEIKMADMPEAARTVVTNKTGSSSVIKKVIKETDEGVTMFEIEYTDAAGVECSMNVSTAGDVLATETAVAQNKIPAAVIAALKSEFPNATMKGATMVMKMYYEVEVVIDGKMREVKVNAAGTFEEEDANGEADEKDGEMEDAKADKK